MQSYRGAQRQCAALPAHADRILNGSVGCLLLLPALLIMTAITERFVLRQSAPTKRILTVAGLGPVKLGIKIYPTDHMEAGCKSQPFHLASHQL